MNGIVEAGQRQGHLATPNNERIRATVGQVEAIQRWVPIAILVLIVGLPVLQAILSGSLVFAILGGFFAFLIAGIVIWLVEKVFINPMRHLRFKGAAKTLCQQVRSAPEASQWRYWWTGAPGALSVTADGRLLIVDRSTDYTHLWLTPDQLIKVGVERNATMITNTRHGGRMTFGAGDGFFGAYTTGGRSRSVTHSVETAFLEICYQLERNGPTYTSVIPFGGERRAADELCATITRLDHAA